MFVDRVRPEGAGPRSPASETRRETFALSSRRMSLRSCVLLADLRFEVSRRIKEEFENGWHYDELHGKPISAPTDTLRRPDPEALRWHNEHPYRG